MRNGVILRQDAGEGADKIRQLGKQVQQIYPADHAQEGIDRCRIRSAAFRGGRGRFLRRRVAQAVQPAEEQDEQRKPQQQRNKGVAEVVKHCVLQQAFESSIRTDQQRHQHQQCRYGAKNTDQHRTAAPLFYCIAPAGKEQRTECGQMLYRPDKQHAGGIPHGADGGAAAVAGGLTQCQHGQEHRAAEQQKPSGGVIVPHKHAGAGQGGQQTETGEGGCPQAAAARLAGDPPAGKIDKPAPGDRQITDGVTEVEAPEQGKADAKYAQHQQHQRCCRIPAVGGSAGVRRGRKDIGVPRRRDIPGCLRRKRLVHTIRLLFSGKQRAVFRLRCLNRTTEFIESQ